MLPPETEVMVSKSEAGGDAEFEEALNGARWKRVARRKPPPERQTIPRRASGAMGNGGMRGRPVTRRPTSIWTMAGEFVLRAGGVCGTGAARDAEDVDGGGASMAEPRRPWRILAWRRSRRVPGVALGA